ncbi:MAG: YggS family pyridoxal phosphate-dependent enzyme [Desulforhopalus sp.]|nr:YggS family pyridoxal phosphate-dependent enzyme [Desulforhopalus sp.]
MIAHNLQLIHEKISVAAHNAGRNPQDIKLVAVSKLFPVESIKEALAAGQLVFGENYIQELQTKRALLPATTIFHFIGHLQSNKAKFAAETCNMVETVDSFKLGKALHNHLERINKTLDILIQVNIGDDPQKAGVPPEEAEHLLIQLNELQRLRVCGLMTIPPLAANPEGSRPHFRNLRILLEKLMGKGLFPHIAKPELSMGMSDDYHIAIDEGATIVRVGTAIFGQRS